MFTSENLQSAYADATVREDAEGRWLSLRAALAYAKVSKPTLYSWTRSIPFLPGQKLRTRRFTDGNGKNRYYLESQLDQIIKARATAWPDRVQWVLVKEACSRFGWSERNLHRWLKEGCPDVAGDFPRAERRTVPITMTDGREQSAEKLFLYLPDLERIAAAQAGKNSAAQVRAGARITTAEAMQRLGVDRQWLRRRITGCAELGGETLNVERREVRRANGYRTRRIYDYFFLKEQIDRLAQALGTPQDVFVDDVGRPWWSRKAALAECGKRFPNLTPRILQHYPNKPCPALDYQVLHALKQPRPVGKGGRYGTLDYFLEADLLRLKPPDATKRKEKLGGSQLPATPDKQLAKRQPGEAEALGEGNRDSERGETKHRYKGTDKTGRPYEPRTTRVYEFCYREFVTNQRSRAQVLNEASRVFGEDGPREESDVKRFAKRFAERFDPPLPLDRGSRPKYQNLSGN